MLRCGMNLRNTISFGFEQTFTISNWWEDEGFCNTSDTKLKRQKMLDLATTLSTELDANLKESKDVWDNLQYDILKNGITEFTITMDPGCIEVKTRPQLVDDLESYASPLFIAAQKAELYPYRGWWYGVNKGTEGGCHVNMGGLTQEQNIFLKQPDLLIKYAAFTHNRPFLTYAFAGVDVGAGGNCQRLDEKSDFNKSIQLFKEASSVEFNSLEDVYNYFKNSSIVTDRSSHPSFRKLAAPFNMIEDRASQSVRSAHEFKLLAEIRIKILEYIKDKEIEELNSFKDLHGFKLCSFDLWQEFQSFCLELNLNPVDYQIFFDRSYPILFNGINQPSKFKVKESKRPRTILEVYKNSKGEVTGKKVDTNYKRFEVYYNTESEDQFEFICNDPAVEYISPTIRHNAFLNFGEKGTSYYCYIDVKMSEDAFLINIGLKDKLLETIVESCNFDLKQMFFV